MFRINRDNHIKTVITKTSAQRNKEISIAQAAESSSKICPNCGHLNDFLMPVVIKKANKVRCIINRCNKCGTEWETQYKL